MSIQDRVSAWNAARYEQEYDKELALELLEEEYTEWLDSETEVEALDAICDVTYVACGVLWKLEAEDDRKTCDLAWEYAMSFNKQEVLAPMTLCSVLLDLLECDLIEPVFAMFVFRSVCVNQMMYLGLSAEQCNEALLAVCDSNDTKPAKKTASNIKANVDKGAEFVPPTETLQKILDNRANRVH